jgi:Zn-dependent protease with chaperone function
MRLLALLLLCLVLVGCGSSRKLPLRSATGPEEAKLRDALAPLLAASGIWRGPEDGCAVALGIETLRAIDVGVGPHPRCKFGLVVTTGALQSLDQDELQTALAHEIGHVQLGHFSSRAARRQVEPKAPDRGDRGSPVESDNAQGLGQSRAYDRQEELAADRYAVELLDKLAGSPGRGCTSVMTLIERLDLERLAPMWSHWLNTHPTPGARLAALGEICPKTP